MKKFESIDDRLFVPLAEEDERRNRIVGGEVTGYISLIQTNDPNPDEQIDHG
jgi:hypothetical protein